LSKKITRFLFSFSLLSYVAKRTFRGKGRRKEFLAKAKRRTRVKKVCHRRTNSGFAEIPLSLSHSLSPSFSLSLSSISESSAFQGKSFELAAAFRSMGRTEGEGGLVTREKGGSAAGDSLLLLSSGGRLGDVAVVAGVVVVEGPI